ncbi:leucine rich repeat protein [Scheffersomyces stipitis CBS 6054]|uniref:Leucine rich repeat protein n=1 Tax=Scheffersomyces stipitis (strain ATCC 58785 / CBS 6054 / NBRC 10063 / NRRL Y-11545) TaxID=322104 RepID=A3LNU5_PICST|nr:leucine rich repeat protein [Scheffersomyces stipitis CBS 6054]ABN64388.2 leucine rich repeat protein [Scheffersomyces stipitis CBS 6054]
MTPSFVLPLSALPDAIIDRVLSYLEVADLTQLIGNSDFLCANPDLLAAIARKLQASNISYNNRIAQYSFLHMYLRTPTYINKRNLQFLSHRRDLYRLVQFDRILERRKECGKELIDSIAFKTGLATCITISYYIWDLSDIADFLDLVLSIEPSSLTYNLELEFDPALRYLIDLQYMLGLCSSHLNKQTPDGFQSLLVYNHNHAGDFVFDMANTNFLALQNVWFENSNVKIKSSWGMTQLKDLNLHPNNHGYNLNHPIRIQKFFPQHLRELKLGNCIIGEKTTNYPIPSNLRSISLRTIRDVSNETTFCKILLLTNLQNNLEELTVESIYNQTNSHVDFFELIEPNENNLDTFISSLPRFLTSLNLSNNNIQDLSQLGKDIPATIVKLNLADNTINWALHIPDFSRLDKLKILKLSNTHLGAHLASLKFPDSIVELSLEVNQIVTLENVRFPKSLKDLGVGSNKITSVGNNPMFPKGIGTIHFTENKLSGSFDLSTNHLGEELDLKVLYLNFNSFKHFNQIKLPSNLRLLNFDDCKFAKLENIHFQDSIEELSFSGCTISSIQNVTFGSESRLKYFNLSQNSIRNIESLRLPDSIQTFDISSNLIESIPSPDYFNLDNIQVVRLTHNRLRSVSLRLFTKLRVLDLSFNMIKKLSLRFPRNSTTKLNIINLSHNELTSISPQVVGHNVDGTYHSHLVEIDIINNRMTTEDIKSKLDEFPALKCFLVGTTGKQDRFGYEIGKNLINEGLCLGKRIDELSM